MKATEAREKSILNANRNKMEEKKTNRRKFVEALEENRRFVKEFEKELRNSIKYSVQKGHQHYELTLSQDSMDFAVRRFTKNEYDKNCWLEDPFKYLEKSRYGKQIANVMNILRRDGFKVELINKSVEHDDSVAYLNSGGESGSEKPWWSTDNILTISW